MSRVVLPVAPNSKQYDNVQDWQDAITAWGNDTKGKLETYSRQASTAIDSTPIGLNAPSSGAFTTLSATGAITGSSTLSLTGAITAPSITLGGGTGAILGAFNGKVGATTPNTGGFTSLNLGSTFAGSTTTLSSHLALYGSTYGHCITSNRLNYVVPSSASHVQIVSGADIAVTSASGLRINEQGNGTTTLDINASGDSNGANIRLIGNGGTTPNKYIRASSGAFQIINSAYSGTPLSLTDAGALTITDALSAVVGNFSGQLNVTGNIVGSAYTFGGFGYMTRVGGAGGAFGSNTFNFFWTGSAVQVYIDAVLLGTMTIASDERYKHTIAPLPDTALDRLLKLRPVSYRFADKRIFKDDGNIREGLIAQEVESVIPSAVEGDDPKTLNLTPLIAVSIKAIQELTARVAALEAAAKHKE